MTRKILLFSVFDDEFGPMPAFYLPADEDEELIMNLAVQSLTASFFGDYSKDHQGKAIMALTTVDLAVFIYFFIIPSSKSRGGTRPAAISILVDKEEENLLYVNSTYLENRIKQVLPALKSEDPSASTVELMRLYQDIKKIDQQVCPLEPEKFSIKSIMDMIKEENLAKMLHCLICNIPVVITGKDNKSIVTICNSLSDFIPHKVLIIETVTSETERIPAFDILAIEEGALKNRPEVFQSLLELPLFNIDDGKFQNFRGDYIFSETLLKKVRKMKIEGEILTFVRISILKMIKKAEQLADLLEQTEGKMDDNLILEKLNLKRKYFELVLLLLGEIRVELQKKIETKDSHLKKFLASKDNFSSYFQ